MTITLRGTKGSELTHSELDANFTDLAGQITTVENTYLTQVSASNTYLTLTSGANTYISLSTLKSTVAASSSFADFKTRIADL